VIRFRVVKLLLKKDFGSIAEFPRLELICRAFADHSMGLGY